MTRRILEHTLKPTLEVALPNPLLLILLPVGVLGLFTRGRWVLAAGMLPLFLLIYARHTFFLVHYAAVVAPALIVLALLGGHAIASALPKSARCAGQIIAGSIIAAVGLTAYPQLQAPTAPDAWAFPPILRPLRDPFAKPTPQPADDLLPFAPQNS